MELPVLIEPIADNGFRARLGEPLQITAEGPTKEAALANLHKLLLEQLGKGKEIGSINVTNGLPLWMRGAGIFKEDDPVIQQWVKCMQEYRDEVENDPNYL